MATNRSIRFTLVALAGATGFACVAPPQEWPEWASEKIQPPDVYVRVGEVRDEIEILRAEMGRPAYGGASFKVAQATPREVYYQAQALLRRAQRFAVEHLGGEIRESDRVAPPALAVPGDVYGVVSESLDLLQQVKRFHRIEQRVQAQPRDASKRPNDVYNSILKASRQLNLLLDQRISPSDVFEEVTLATSYADAILMHYDSNARLQAPAFERRKRPGDVYRRLLRCFDLVEDIGTASGVKLLQVDTSGAEIDLVTPSDVFELATLLVSELAYLNARMGGDPPAPPPYGGRKWPSDVFQRAGLLEAQLERLSDRVTSSASTSAPVASLAGR